MSSLPPVRKKQKDSQDGRWTEGCWELDGGSMEGFAIGFAIGMIFGIAGTVRGWWRNYP